MLDSNHMERCFSHVCKAVRHHPIFSQTDSDCLTYTSTDSFSRRGPRGASAFLAIDLRETAYDEKLPRG